MNQTLYSISVALIIAFGISSAEADSQIYIVPVNADGSVSKTDGDYSQKIAMKLQSDGSFSLSETDIAKGVYFYKTTDGSGTLYNIPSWAVSHPVIGYPNPLSICTDKSPYIELPEGKYDFSFYSRDITGTGYNYFTVKQSDQTGTVYPAALYLVWAEDGYITLPGDNGVYSGDMTVTEHFVIAYEPTEDDPTFLFGPASGKEETLTYGNKVEIGYEKGVEYGFVFTPITEDSAATVEVNLAAEHPYITVNEDVTTGAAIIEGDMSESNTEYYTLAGMRVDKPTSGLYIVRNGTSARKVALR